jgi:hypothetical protein
MWVRRSEYAALRAQVERLAAERDEAVAEVTACRSTTVDTCRKYTDTADALVRARLARLSEGMAYEGRITRLVRACARYRTELAKERRRAARLQGRLDDAVGLTSPALDAGAAWQQRRQDKTRTAVTQ